MRTFLDRFYDYVHSPEGFNCVQFRYMDVVYQLVSGAGLCYTGNDGVKHCIPLSGDIEQILDEKIMPDGKSLRDVWGKAGENDLFPDFY